MHGLGEIRAMNRGRATAPHFARRHYRVIADAINATMQLPHDDPKELWGDLVQVLCEKFAADNRDFDRATFIAACDGRTTGATDEH